MFCLMNYFGACLPASLITYIFPMITFKGSGLES